MLVIYTDGFYFKTMNREMSAFRAQRQAPLKVSLLPWG